MFKLAKKLGDDQLEELGERMTAEVEAAKGAMPGKKGRAA
jgi:hypothetical protein